MGLFDFLRRPDRQRDAAAIRIDLAAGVLQECPVCRGLFDRQRDDRLPVAELMAHQHFDRGDPLVAVFAGDRADLLRRLRSVRDRFEFHCDCHSRG